MIPVTGGPRKVRVPLAGRGKRSGTQFISCFVGRRGVYLLLAYAKDEQVNPTPEQARIPARLVKTLS
ncbi:hypothetical protein PUR29_31160 [Methylobacterium ajmalii]|uniref:Addiction module toxin RelE n=1 Tax=Methylobacterium ajmalii TaxID=2738439 RepID=A0ABV0A3H0_9HYPH